jgi:hypothetical protein
MGLFGADAKARGPVVRLDLLQRVRLTNPSVLRVLLAGLPTSWVSGNEGPNTWSAYDIVGHLIDGEETDWMVRARIILAEGQNRRFEPFDRFRHLRVNPGRSLEDRLAQFESLRKAKAVLTPSEKSKQ